MSRFPGITRLVASGFRGASQRFEMNFESAKPFVAIFGENGTGKSTLVDAIEFAIRGTKGSLESFSSTAIKDLSTKGLPTAPNLAVQVTIGDNTIQAFLRGAKAIQDGLNNRPHLEILRRSRLAQLVAAAPAERYAELKRFVDVDGVAASEKSLDQACKEAKDQLNRKSSAVARALEELRSLRSSTNDASPADLNVSALVMWGRSLSGKAAPEHTGILQQLGELPLRLRQLDEARSIVASCRRDKSAAEEALEILDRDSRSLVTELGNDTLVIFDLLVASQRILVKEPPATACPLCAQPVDGIALRSDVTQRLAQLEKLAVFRDQRPKLMKQQESLVARLEETERSEQNAADALRGTVGSLRHYLGPELIEALEKAANAQIDAPAQAPEIIPRLEQIRQQLKAVEEKHADVTRVLSDYENTNRVAMEAEAELKHLERTLQIVRELRKQFVESILDQVTAEVNRLYAEIHPDEQDVLGSARFNLDPNKPASLLQTVRFGGLEEVSPQACYSESHLLTLALCLWLALAKRDQPERTVLVLDDVIHAVDAPHMQRLAMLLCIERENFAQVILTTHSRRFVRYLRSGLGPSRDLDFRTLRWNLERGISSNPEPGDLVALEVQLAEPFTDRYTLTAAGGRLLESLLRQLAALYRRPIPFAEPTEPTLGELFSAWSKKDASRVCIERGTDGTFVEQGTLWDILDRLNQLNNIRNIVAAHLNTSEGDDVPEKEVRAYAQSICELGHLLLCLSCGQLPSRAQDDFFQCHCKKQRLRPKQLS